MVYEFIRDPEEIYRQSFAIIRSEACLDGLSPIMEKLAVRIAHSCGMVDVARNLKFSKGAAEIGRATLKKGTNIFVDSEMVAIGINRHRLPVGIKVICTLNQPQVPGLAEEKAITRSAAAVELWVKNLDGAIVVIGNAPTALFYLLELLNAGAPKPSLIIGLPVGFVGAAESKDALVKNSYSVPFITLPGRLGGSAMASASINALAEISNG